MTRKYPVYFRNVEHLKEIDVYRIISLFGLTDPCLQHALKKVLCAGIHGGKDIERDVQEAIDALTRWQEMHKEDNEYDK